jgi:hypothetical protein
MVSNFVRLFSTYLGRTLGKNKNAVSGRKARRQVVAHRILRLAARSAERQLKIHPERPRVQGIIHFGVFRTFLAKFWDKKIRTKLFGGPPPGGSFLDYSRRNL